MANYILKEMPDIQKKGKRKVYPKMETYTLKTLDDLAKYIQDLGSPYNPSIIKSVVDILADAAVTWLSNGHTVKIDGLGTFSLSLGFDDKKGNELSEEKSRMEYRHVKIKSLNFRPDEKIVQKLRRATTLTRSEGGVVQVTKERYTKEERLARAIQHIEQHGAITLTEYANMNGLSRTVASRELKAFTNDPFCLIKAKGVAPHKTWTI
ncbi:MAG: hypothetical protein J5790_06490 [Bacteroidaceae bacterium]|nr:hypothetical protein [Bacteroidaceae bacterium]